MKTIQQFKSFCGKIFNNSKECIRYENISRQVNQILSTIIDSDKYNNSCSFSNGNGFIQHPRGTYNTLEKELIRLSNDWFETEGTDDLFTCFNYYLGRCINDSNMSCLNKLSYKLMTIDEQDREYGQPFFKLNPDKISGGQLN